MKIDLLNTAAQLCGDPVAVSASHLTALTSMEAMLVEPTSSLAERLEAEPDNSNLMWATQERPGIAGATVTAEGIAVVRIAGTLFRQSRSWHRHYGFMSYGALVETVEEALTHPGVKAVLMEFDTPGGPAQGCFDSARAIRDAATQAGKPVWAHVNEAALSAGYALASAADEIAMAATGLAGSIGVLAMVADYTGEAEKHGVKFHVFKAGEAKDDTSPHTGMSAEAAARLQDDIDHLNDKFCQLIADHRPLEKSEVVGFQAQTYRGEKAEAAGLVDKIEPFRDTLARLTAKVSQAPASQPGAQAQASDPAASAAAENASEPGASQDEPPAGDLATEGEGEGDADPQAAAPGSDAQDPGEQQAPAGDDDTSAEAAAHDQGQLEPMSEADIRATERDRVSGLCKVAEQAAVLGVTIDLQAAIDSDKTADDLRAEILNQAAEADETRQILTAPNPQAAAPVAGVPAKDHAAGWGKAVANVNAANGH